MPDSLLIGVVIASAVAVSYWLTMGLASLFDRISRWSANRYARKMGYPTLVDVAKRFEPATKQDMAKARDAMHALLDDVRRERLRIERGEL